MINETAADLGPRPLPTADDEQVVGLIPAAGYGRRMGEIPCSKELLPLGWSADRVGPRPARSSEDDTAPQSEGPSSGRPEGKAIIEHLIERFARGGIRRALVIMRQGKWDIPAHLEDGHRWGLDLAYLVLPPTGSAVETLDAARPWVEDCSIALGFPDIVFHPPDAFLKLRRAREHRGADVVLGLFPNRQAERSDMVDAATDGTVRRILIKQPDQGLAYAWSIALWTPVFTRYLHRFRADHRHAPEPRELYVGDVMQAAIDDGLYVTAEVFEEGASADLGTPEALASPPSWA